ncbi:MAG: tetratricopeptide repeat protein, partial [Betaproteobacteria bacterium]|nr:tetratricopeptide repeat protein [Betaproteobacteria bacterium]
TLLMQRQDLDGALAEMVAATELEPDDGKFFESLGCVQIDATGWQAARQSFEKAIELGWRTASCFTNRGRARENLGDQSGALEDFNRAVEIGGDPRAIENRALLRANMGDHRGALDDLNIILQSDPDNVNHLMVRATLRGKRGDLKGARADYRRAKKIEPDEPQLEQIKLFLDSKGLPRRH